MCWYRSSAWNTSFWKQKKKSRVKEQVFGITVKDKICNVCTLYWNVWVWVSEFYFLLTYALGGRGFWFINWDSYFPHRRSWLSSWLLAITWPSLKFLGYLGEWNSRQELYLSFSAFQTETNMEKLSICDGVGHRFYDSWILS